MRSKIKYPFLPQSTLIFVLINSINIFECVLGNVNWERLRYTNKYNPTCARHNLHSPKLRDSRAVTDGWLAAASAHPSCSAASANPLVRSFPRLRLHPVRRATCLVPIGRIISNCQDATTTSIPYAVAYSRLLSTTSTVTRREITTPWFNVITQM